jgi:hypothetical protein
MEDQATSDSHQVSIPDGGNSSDFKEISLSMTEERYLMFQEVLMMKIETLLFTTSTERLTKDGRLFMLTNIQESLLKDK